MHKLLVSMEGCSSSITHFCLVTSLKLLGDRSDTQTTIHNSLQHYLACKIWMEEMYCFDPPLQIFTSSYQRGILHHLPTYCPFPHYYVDLKAAAGWGGACCCGRTAATADISVSLQRLRKHPARGGEVENGPGQGSPRLWVSTAEAAVKLFSEVNSWARRFESSGDKCLEAPVFWLQYISSDILYSKCQTCYCLCCTIKAWNPFMI